MPAAGPRPKFPPMSISRVAGRAARDEAAEDLVRLLHALGLSVVVRDPETAEVLAASPAAQSVILKSRPDLVNVVAARLGGHQIRVEALRPRGPESWALTPRQRGIADGLLEGLDDAELARRFGISPHTVRRHVEEILRRLGAADRKEAMAELRRRRREGTAGERSRDAGATAGD